jgi:hypothetical protein
MGWPNHPIFPIGGGWPPQLTPKDRFGVAGTTPMAPPPRALGGGVGHPQGPVWGGRRHSLG